jgi:hypothetical protein
MPDLPISGLPSLSIPEPNDVFAIVNNSITKKTTFQAVGNAVFNQISSSVILPSQTGSFGVTSYYGSFYHTASLTNPVASAENTMSFSTTDFAYGVSISGSFKDKIKIQNAGVYNIQFSTQLDKTTSTNTTIYIWLNKNGTNIPDSNTGVTLGGGSNDASVAAWNFFVSSSAGDYYQLKWGADRDNARILYTSASIGPNVPSIILTVNRIA